MNRTIVFAALSRAAVLVAACALAGMACTAAPVLADTSVSFGPSFSNAASSPQIDFTITVDKTVRGEATLRIDFEGDLNAAGTENLSVLVDGVEVANFNSTQCGADNRTITIPSATLSPLITDGQVVLSFRAGTGTNALCNPTGIFAAGPNPFSLAVKGTFAFQGGGSALRTAQAIGSFMAQRNNQILSNGPDEGRQIDRLNDGTNGGGAGAGQFSNSAAAPGSPNRSVALNDPSDAAPSRSVMRGSLTDRFETSNRGAMMLGRGDDANPFPGQIPTLGPADQSNSAVSVGGPFRLSGTFDDATRVAFSASMRDVARYGAQKEAERDQDQMGLGMKGRSASKPWSSPWDIWVDVKYAGYNANRANSDYNGHFGIASVGTDYVINRNLLVGTFIQFDNMSQKANAQPSSVSGTGWMIGPYATVRVAPNVYLQSRAAYGRSNNEVSPLMTYSDHFSSERWLVATTLAGRWISGAWTFKPAVSVSYMEDEAKGYVDSTGASIPTVRTTLGQLRVGPEVSYRYKWSQGVMLEPHGGVQVIWNFADTVRADGFALVGGDQAGPSGVRGRTDLGIRALAADGLIVDLSGAYDGIGASGYSAFVGRANVRAPLN
jgi:outer membrane autotransporter protein